MNQKSSVEPDEVNVGLLAVVGTFTAVVVVLIVVLLQAWFYNWRGSMAEAKILPMNSPETPLGRALWNSRRRSTAITGSTARPKCGRSRSSGRWKWWPRKWPPHKSPSAKPVEKRGGP